MAKDRIGRFFQLAGTAGTNWRDQNVYPPFGGAILITPEDTDELYIKGAWNHALRVTAPGYDMLDFEAAIEWLREHHPNWEIHYPSECFMVNFRPTRDRANLEHYTPPD